MTRLFTFQASETRYHGYHFRICFPDDPQYIPTSPEGLLLEEQAAFSPCARDQRHVIQQVFPLLKHCAQQIIEALLFHDGWENLLERQHCTSAWKWCECSSCSQFAFYPRRKVPTHDHYSDTPKGLMLTDTPRLRAASTAAREARF